MNKSITIIIIKAHQALVEVVQLHQILVVQVVEQLIVGANGKNQNI
mgnify:CR=1 FL=1